MKYCSKAAAMGEPWVQYNSMTERHEFLHFKVRRNEFFTQQWNKRREFLVNAIGDTH